MKEYIKPLPPLVEKKTGKRKIDTPMENRLKGNKDLLKTKYDKSLEILK